MGEVPLYIRLCWMIRLLLQAELGRVVESIFTDPVLTWYLKLWRPTGVPRA